MRCWGPYLLLLQPQNLNVAVNNDATPPAVLGCRPTPVVCAVQPTGGGGVGIQRDEEALYSHANCLGAREGGVVVETCLWPRYHPGCPRPRSHRQHITQPL